MPKTPDKIKKGLNAPIPVHFHIGDPEPRLTPLALHDLEFLHEDALALIQQLETTVSEKENVVAELSGKIGQLQAERDAAAAALKSNCVCTECKWFDDDLLEGHCNDCHSKNSSFEWRGVQKEE